MAVLFYTYYYHYWHLYTIVIFTEFWNRTSKCLIFFEMNWPSGMAVVFDGCPFMIIGHKVYHCSAGPPRHRHITGTVSSKVCVCSRQTLVQNVTLISTPNQAVLCTIMILYLYSVCTILVYEHMLPNSVTDLYQTKQSVKSHVVEEDFIRCHFWTYCKHGM